MPLIPIKGKSPVVEEGAWVSPNATVAGEVEIQAGAVVWPGAVIRAQFAPIRIGKYTTVFEGVVMFTKSSQSPIQIGSHNIIEAGAALFGTLTSNFVTIGEGSLLLEGSSVGEGAVLLKGSAVPPGAIVTDRAVVKGDPVATVREMTRNEIEVNKSRAEHFSELFHKMHRQLPNLQPYALTEASLLKMFLAMKIPDAGLFEDAPEVV
jgi:carbonic anhydrase/acetyltransferase-like protein (isoleucine patch superfamily)